MVVDGPTGRGGASSRESFARGDLFEVVPGQVFREACPLPPSELFRRLRERNPSPYGFLINLGEAEYLVGASPEMYVRVDGDIQLWKPNANGYKATPTGTVPDAIKVAKTVMKRMSQE